MDANYEFLEDVMLLHANVYHQPEYFNRNCFCMIPACFKAEIVEDLSEFSGHHFDPQGIGHSEQDAIDMLLSALKASGFHGRLRINR